MTFSEILDLTAAGCFCAPNVIFEGERYESLFFKCQKCGTRFSVSKAAILFYERDSALAKAFESHLHLLTETEELEQNWLRLMGEPR